MQLNRKVFELTESIPPGMITTYGEIARALGDVKLSRAVGRALHENPKPIDIPCHRVVMSDGRIGGYNQGAERKMDLLRNEGIRICNGRILDFERVFFMLNGQRKPLTLVRGGICPYHLHDYFSHFSCALSGKVFRVVGWILNHGKPYQDHTYTAARTEQGEI